MPWQVVVALIGGGMLLLSLMLVWNAGLVCGRYDTRQRRSLRSTLRWIAFSVAVCALILLLAAATESAAAVFASLILLAFFGSLIALTAWLQFRASRRQSLVWLLAAAAEKGVPLHDAAHAFADENNNDRPARQLSLLLQAGAPLPEALRRASISLPFDARLAVDAGSRLDLLGPCMRDVMVDANDIDGLIRESIERLIYFMVVTSASTGVGIFMMVKILPVMSKLSAEFGIGGNDVLDTMTAASPWLLTLSVIMLVLMSFVAFIGGLYYVGLLPVNFLGVGVLARRLDGSRLLRVLAAAVSSGKSLAETLRTLTLHFPRNTVRRKLFHAGQLVTSGNHWIDSLKTADLITESERAVLRSAEKAGNLDWAMNNLAALSARRVAYRMRFWFSLIFPTIICLTAVVFLFLAMSLFIPLSSLIQALA